MPGMLDQEMLQGRLGALLLLGAKPALKHLHLLKNKTHSFRWELRLFGDGISTAARTCRPMPHRQGRAQAEEQIGETERDVDSFLLQRYALPSNSGHYCSSE